ncbi:hypothetical protein PVL29_021075 [Vitis rotundifolia]|uniref:Pectinesterase inhibitor domain-containing protein n=1 Tax=Vitis rotundifolia TaxID=103349 RepID=A0AA38YYI4_VITRO|nr:hypothetical protein PVL29_021075 [Vitis rotundifolia]
MSTEMESFTCLKLSSSRGLAAIVALFFFYLSLTTCSAASPEPQSPTNTIEFIRTSCGVTMYPKLCFKTLSAYASTIQTSPMELASAALNVSLKGAQSSSNKVLNLSKGQGLSRREAAAITDCIENMQDSVDELQQSLVAMKDLQGPDFQMKMSDIVTWVSAALTDEDTCMDGFEGHAMKGELKSTIRSYIVSVAQLTSNALAIINKFLSTQGNQL